MESPALDDDICILKHETAYVSPESPVSACAGDESVASHFALVTAYEDIKKRLRDTEKENGLLRRRVKQLEDKVLLSSFHFRPEAPPSEGPQYMNKAFSAYRGIYIEKEDLQMELNKVKKEKLDLERLLKEQLQAKELELLQLRSEMDTSQVMKSLTDTADYWQVDKRSSEIKIHSLQEQLDRLQIENDALHKLCRAGQDVSENCVVDDQSLEALTDFRTMAIVQSYRDVLSEVSRLQSVVQSQSELVKKMRERPAPPVFRRAASTVPVQCLDDVQKSSVPRPPSAPPLPSTPDGLQENCLKDPWTVPRPAPLGSPGVRLNPTLRMSSLDDSSWSFPSPPRPSDALFWDQTKPKSPAGDWAQPH
ncbi:5-azacytidine-induced protein 2-like isoform X2 [Sinocyclocheilus rhinocerous]|uniref:5-azacytidine-induced protein 2-like isoform X1 n=1 Tax=Sinocyclocheilus rhinocerous TaxID=307959 RepID=UPI0007B9C662|nr:PREDICTED: 5-azacytidine-induced protein 2-like isoform X1 [Sinocyclocheilus rhinocerous]XP_016414472.1 PREDICTED: 5-azacytidine-induced protein 2-like isoform X1 [Sinocyclocheilus rhinocerous]XP_016414473.1 PREDICTED: 5-azacytidine-induced protein 2-like isoform X2 [Sinocyclocheilus rhinocerous]